MKNTFLPNLILTLGILFLSYQLHAQVAISYYPFQSLLSVSSNPDYLFWADYRIETNTFLSNMNMELSPMWNFRRDTLTSYYWGVGISINPANPSGDLPLTNGYFSSIGVRIKPLRTHQAFHIIFEISPYINREFSGGNLRTRLGFCYNL